MTSQLFTKDNEISFLKRDGTVASVKCRGQHDTSFVMAAADAVSAGITYGLSSDGFVSVFRTSNLLQKPDASECVFQSKFKAIQDPVGILAVIGGVVVSSETHSFYFDTKTLQKKPCPFDHTAKQFLTSQGSLVLT